MKNGQNHAKLTGTLRMALAVAVAFAMVITVLPSASVCAEDQNVEPTQSAPEMVQQNEDEPPVGGEDGEEVVDETTESIPENSELDTMDTTEDESTPVPETTAVTTTTVNTSGKGWKTPKGKKPLSLTLCRNADGTEFNLIAQAGQKLYAYDTLQGASAGKGYGYFTLYNRDNNRVKIVKVRLADMKVVKVSAALPLNHANGITYNGRRNIIVVANSTPKPKRISIIDANTLKLKYHKKIKVTRRVKGMTSQQRKRFKGIGAIAYNEKRNIYVCRTRESHDILLLKANFKPYKRIRQKSRLSGMVYQGIDTYKNCIMVCQSFSGKKKYNAVTVYNMKGKKIARFTMGLGKPRLELETVFHDGNQFYAGFYSFYGSKSDTEQYHVKRDNRIYRINNL